MPVHDWTRAPAIFNSFQHGWVSSVRSALNDRLLPPDYYALAEWLGVEPEEADPAVKQVAIRHVSGHRLVAVVEIVSPGNKDSAGKLQTFADKARAYLTAGVHLTLLDLHPPTPRDPRGIHPVVWEPLVSDRDPYTPPPGEPLTLVSYVAPPRPQLFLEPTAVGATLLDMPVFLTRERYIDLPLEDTYRQAWEAVPAFWKAQIAG